MKKIRFSLFTSAKGGYFMDLFRQKFDSLTQGTPVRLTLVNGQTIDGIVSQKDDDSALEIAVTEKVLVRYDHIVSFRESGISGSSVTVTAPVPKKLTCTLAELKNAFNAIADGAMKTKLNPVYNDINVGHTNHNPEKIQGAPKKTEDLIEDLKSDGEIIYSDVYNFYAHVCMFAGQKEKAAEALNNADMAPKRPDDIFAKTDSVIPSVSTYKPKTDSSYIHLTGKVFTYSKSNSEGKIRCNEDGKEYLFTPDDIGNPELKSTFKEMSGMGSLRTFDANGDYTSVSFDVIRRCGKDYATKIVPVFIGKFSGIVIPTDCTRADIEKLYANGEYEQAIDYCFYMLRSTQTIYDIAFFFKTVIKSCTVLMNTRTDNESAIYSKVANDLIAEYEQNGNIERIHLMSECTAEFYELNEDYKNTVRYAEMTVASCEKLIGLDEERHKDKRNNIINSKITIADCFEKLGNSEKAKEILDECLKYMYEYRIFGTKFETVKNKLAEYNGTSASPEKTESEEIITDEETVTPENAPDESAEDYEEELYESEEDEAEDDDDDDDDTDIPDDETALNSAYNAYDDKNGFFKLGLTRDGILEKIKGFDEEHLYCLLTWLAAASKIVDSTTELKGDFSLLTDVQALNTAFGYAYNSPLVECEYESSNVLAQYQDLTDRSILPDDYEALSAAASLRTLFGPYDKPDYSLANLCEFVKKTSIAEKYPELISLLEKLAQFRNVTGYAPDMFAGYKSNGDAAERVTAAAQELIKQLEAKLDIYESNGQVRRTREIIFTESPLRKCLDIAATDDRNRAEYVSQVISDMFMKDGKSLSEENISLEKTDAFIDECWQDVVEIILNEKRVVRRPHDRLKSGKRSNIVSYVKKMTACVCDWLEIAKSSEAKQDWAVTMYEEAEPEIKELLEKIIEQSRMSLDNDGFGWGVHSIFSAATEIYAKVCGTYDSNARKYFFADFMKDGEILLNDSFLPELQSTFCESKSMNILKRIERHAETTLPAFEERLKSIVSPEDIEHDFRCAKMIFQYAADTGYDLTASGVTEETVDNCLKYARAIFDDRYREFYDKLQLDLSYGRISNINGEVDRLNTLAKAWFDICRITKDYGFYEKLLVSIENKISADAAAKTDVFLEQLKALCENPEYDFGIFTKEGIREFILGQNFAAAEQVLNSIRRRDTAEVEDYTKEPYGYFREFEIESDVNYDIAGKAEDATIEKGVKKAGRGRNLEDSLSRLAGGKATKDIRGGAELITKWPTQKADYTADLTVFLNRLGFDTKSVTPDSGKYESYTVYCNKRIGKVVYPHPIAAFGSETETNGFRVLCLYGTFGPDALLSRFLEVNATPQNTLVLLNHRLTLPERRMLAKKIKQEKSITKTFIVIDRVTLLYLAKHYSEGDISKRLMAVTLPFSYCQPFIESSTVTMPPELFTGRADELAKIEDVNGVNLVYGGRQLGKSALLKMARRHIDKNGNNARAVYLDIQNKDCNDAARHLCKKLVLEGILAEGSDCGNWNDLCDLIYRRLSDEDPETRISYLLIMLDEADEFIKTAAESGDSPLSAIKNLPTGRFKLVMAGVHNLSRFDRTVFHENSSMLHLSHLVVKQFKRQDAIELLTKILAYLGFRFSDGSESANGFIGNILEKTHYYPGLIQFYCQKLIEYMRNADYAEYSESDTPYYDITEEHFKKVFVDRDFTDLVNRKLEASLFTEEKGHSFYHVLSLIFAALYHENDKKGSFTVDDIRNKANDLGIKRIIGIDNEKLKEYLDEMCDLNILIEKEKGYGFATDGFREYLGNQKKVDDMLTEYMEEDFS